MKKTILCIPGLGGHPSAFGLYESLLKEFKFRFIEFVNIKKALVDLQKIINEENEVILFCSCYGIQLALKIAEFMPQTIGGIIVVEPFFAQFHWWRTPAVQLARGLLWLSKTTDKFGWRRKTFDYRPDYVKLSKYPIYCQPIFDMRWQNLTDYLDKIRDLLLFELPLRVETPTLIVFSHKGFIRSEKIKKNISEIFVNSTSIETGSGTHNIITMSGKPVAEAVRNWINNKII